MSDVTYSGLIFLADEPTQPTIFTINFKDTEATIFINDDGLLDFKGKKTTEALDAFFHYACTLKNKEIVGLAERIKELEETVVRLSKRPCQQAEVMYE
jgi:hypothetical protein